MHRFLLTPLLIAGCSLLPSDRYYYVLDDYYSNRHPSPQENIRTFKHKIGKSEVSVFLAPTESGSGQNNDSTYFTNPFTLAVHYQGDVALDSSRQCIWIQPEGDSLIQLVSYDEPVSGTGIILNTDYGKMFKGVILPRKNFILKLEFLDEAKGISKKFEIPFKYTKHVSRQSKFWAKFLSV